MGNELRFKEVTVGCSWGRRRNEVAFEAGQFRNGLGWSDCEDEVSWIILCEKNDDNNNNSNNQLFRALYEVRKCELIWI